ncbi:TolC family protein [Bacteroidota bacterium]
MKRISIILSIALGCSSIVSSQETVKGILEEVSQNNTTLTALRQHADAEKLANKTGIYLQNPEVGFNYLWGDPSSIGSRQDFSISQSFDFPTVYSYQNKISDIRNEQVELEYLKQEKAIKLEAEQLLYDLIYMNGLLEVQEERSSNADIIAVSSQSRFELGEISKLEYNKAALNQLNAEKEKHAILVERDAMLNELVSLNGGRKISFDGRAFLETSLPSDFEQWYAEAEENNPILNWLKQELEASLKEEKLNLAKGLPSFHAGYMSESVVGESFRGVSIGLTIPLWENKNAVKYAKARSIAVEGIATDKKIQFYNHLKKLHARALSLKENSEAFRVRIEEVDNRDMLVSALEAGEIDLLDVMLESDFIYESLKWALEMERDLHKAVAELEQYSNK